jgi:hypothetical protein
MKNILVCFILCLLVQVFTKSLPEKSSNKSRKIRSDTAVAGGNKCTLIIAISVIWFLATLHLKIFNLYLYLVFKTKLFII